MSWLPSGMAILRRSKTEIRITGKNSWSKKEIGCLNKQETECTIKIMGFRSQHLFFNIQCFLIQMKSWLLNPILCLFISSSKISFYFFLILLPIRTAFTSGDFMCALSENDVWRNCLSDCFVSNPGNIRTNLFESNLWALLHVRLEELFWNDYYGIIGKHEA